MINELWYTTFTNGEPILYPIYWEISSHIKKGLYRGGNAKLRFLNICCFFLLGWILLFLSYCRGIKRPRFNDFNDSLFSNYCIVICPPEPLPPKYGGDITTLLSLLSRFWEETRSVGQNYVMATFAIKTHMPFVYKLLQRHSRSGDHLKRLKDT